MAVHAEDPLRCSRVPKILNLPLAVATAKAGSTESLISGENGQILNLIATGAAAVRAVVADERSIA
jgi:hypothetical protein